MPTKTTKKMRNADAMTSASNAKVGPRPLQDRRPFTEWRPSVGDNEKDEKLFQHQRFCRAYLGHEGPYRGLLLYHGLGSGKTCSAIATAEALRKHMSQVIVMVPAALEPSFVREVQVCGGRMFKRQQRWKKVVDTNEVTKIVESGAWASPSMVKKMKGELWVPDSLKVMENMVPFDDIKTEKDREDIEAYIVDAIRNRHQFIHYNGLAEEGIRRLLAQRNGRPFDDAVIVIDEVHNFVSNLMGGKKLKAVYDALLDARRCKIMLLSGTPLVNEPVELAWLVNLVHGKVHVHEVKVGPAGLNDSMEMALRNARARHVHQYWEALWDIRKLGSIMLQLLPEGFVRADGDRSGTFVTRHNQTLTEDERIMETLEVIGVPRGTRVVKHTFELLPSDPERFQKVFLLEDGLNPRTKDLLTRRCLGSISFFPGHEDALYPTVNPIQEIRLKMSPRQFTEYTSIRVMEKRREVVAKRFKERRRAGSNNDTDSGAGMRTESRAVCTFVYPESIPRPRRIVGGPEEDQGQQLKEYDDAIQEAIANLKSSGNLIGDKLKLLSPKFAHIIQTVKRMAEAGKGTAIVYSQYRKAEGIDMLAAAMESNGFTQMHVERDPNTHRVRLRIERHAKGKKQPMFIIYSNINPEVEKAILDAFNNRVRDNDALAKEVRRLGLSETNLRGELVAALLITRSGAEGINTRNVRQVHVIEPFWHVNRLDQVIGRARRAHSHDDLPKDERFVDVFTYITTFTDKQRETTKTNLNDGEVTSDEFVLEVARRKKVVLDQLLEMMKRAAVDCTSDCFTVAPQTDVLYAPDMEDDLAGRRR